MTTNVQMHCPSTKKTIENFVISPYQTNDAVLQGVRLAFGIKHAALYTVDARYIADVQSLQEDQRVLVAANKQERMLPDAVCSYTLYDGEEGEDVDPDIGGFGETWEELTEREKCEHIISLNEMKPTSRNNLRVTRPWKPVQADLKAVQNASDEDLTTNFDLSTIETNIEQRWHMTYDHFLPESMRPPKYKVSTIIWDARVLSTLDVLSSFTPGQARLAAEVLEEAVKIRLDDGDHASPIVQCEDVENAAIMIYQRAGVLPAKLTKPKTDRMREKEKRRAMRGRKKVEKNGSGDS